MKGFLLAVLVVFGSGCMQVVGAKKIDAWGLKIEANSGLEVSGGVMQFDRANNTKKMGE